MLAANQTRRWMRTPRGLVWALGTTTALSAGALTWFAWEILQQERTFEVQRARDWLGNRAHQVAQSIDRVLSDAADVLASPEVTSRPGWLSDDGVVWILSQSSVDAVPSSKLRFYPIVPARPVPPETVFAEVEALEFRRRDRTRAIDAYRVMARTRDPGIRAEALMRLGGLLRQARQYDAARAAYSDMATLGDVPMRELPPADLVARDALWRFDRDRSQTEVATAAARRLYLDLIAGRWKLTQRQYEFYAGASATAGTVDQAEDRDAGAVAKAAAVVWDMWQSASRIAPQAQLSPPVRVVAERQVTHCRSRRLRGQAGTVPRRRADRRRDFSDEVQQQRAAIPDPGVPRRVHDLFHASDDAGPES